MLKIKAKEKLPDNILVPTSSFGINYVLGGGLRTGNIHFFWGPAGSGKTTSCLYTIGVLQRLGYHAIIVDTEHSITDDWLIHCGVEEEREIWQANIVEEMKAEFVPELKNLDNQKIAILIDSISQIERGSFFEAESAGTPGGRAQAHNLLWRALLESVHPENIIVLGTVQQTTKIGGYGNPLNAYLSNMEFHLACNIIKLFSSDAAANVVRDKATDKIISQKVTWTIEKSKQAAVRGIRGSYWINPQTSGIDDTGEIVDIAIKNNVIRQGGAWFYYGEEKYHGEKDLRAKMTPELKEMIKEELMKCDLKFEGVADGL